jgi:hypothetical protein
MFVQNNFLIKIGNFCFSGVLLNIVQSVCTFFPAIGTRMRVASVNLSILMYSPCLCFVIHWSGYCTVHVYAYSFIDPVILQSMFLFCLTKHKHGLYNSRINEWQSINMDCTIVGSMNDKHKHGVVHVYALSFIDPAIVQSMFMLCHSFLW